MCISSIPSFQESASEASIAEGSDDVETFVPATAAPGAEFAFQWENAFPKMPFGCDVPWSSWRLQRSKNVKAVRWLFVFFLRLHFSSQAETLFQLIQPLDELQPPWDLVFTFSAVRTLWSRLTSGQIEIYTIPPVTEIWKNDLGFNKKTSFNSSTMRDVSLQNRQRCFSEWKIVKKVCV